MKKQDQFKSALFELEFATFLKQAGLDIVPSYKIDNGEVDILIRGNSEIDEIYVECKTYFYKNTDKGFQHIEINGRTWLITHFINYPNFFVMKTPLTVLITGLILSVLLFLLIQSINLLWFKAEKLADFNKDETRMILKGTSVDYLYLF